MSNVTQAAIAVAAVVAVIVIARAVKKNPAAARAQKQYQLRRGGNDILAAILGVKVVPA